MFVNKLVCDKCGTEVNASDKYCKECGTAGYKDYVKVKEEPSIKVRPSLAKVIIESSRCRGCGKVLPPNSAHTCPELMYRPLNIRWGGPDVKFGRSEFTNR